MSLLENIKKEKVSQNAREMIIFSYPKIGKTELMTHLPGSYLILDFDDGMAYYSGNYIKVNDYTTFSQLCKEFEEKKPQFDFIVFDTITMLYDTVTNTLAIKNYNKDPMNAKNQIKDLKYDITNLSYGAGYGYKRNALQQIINFFKPYCKCLILLGHVADRSLKTDKDGEGNVKDLAIEGKLKDILALKTDAMGLLYRSSPNENTISFNPSIGLIGGTRIPHLSNKEFVISKKLEDGTLETYWDKIFV